MRKPALLLATLACTGLITFGCIRLAQVQAESTPQVESASFQKHLPSPAELDAACVQPTRLFEGKTAEHWRARGPVGLAELMVKMQPTIKAYKEAVEVKAVRPSEKTLAKVDALKPDLLFLDQVAKQRDAYAAGLYWYTDLDEAVAQAKRQGKPVLTLRMLGNLDEEYSCANSRFFRTVLYADESMSKMLREKFVLHWQSVRPVPVITIDMGDGRTIKRTITGNSAHYVLDPNGRVVDCLPGLYASGTFERLLRQSGQLASELTDANDSDFTQTVKATHAWNAAKLDRAWAQYMQVIDLNDAATKKGQVLSQAAKVNSAARPEMPDAYRAGEIALAGKFRIERPLVEAVMPNSAPTAKEAAEDIDVWKRVAQSYAKEAGMDPSSRSLMTSKAPNESVESAMRRALSKTFIESPLVRMVRNFENGLAIETARNEHLLHRQVHDWFARAEAPLDLTQLNKRVYAELFLTPDEDPWLGLVPADTYSALDGGGLIQ